MLTTEEGEQFPYHDAADLRTLLHEATSAGLLLYMPPEEFARWVPDFLEAKQCTWSDSAAKIVGFKVRSGRRIRYIYRASVWPGLTPGTLPALRQFLDDYGVGDVATPGALGLKAMYQLYPEGTRQFRPPWTAWHDLHDHLIAGRTQLFQRFVGTEAVELDMNNAYAAGIAAGVPQGRCWRMFREEDAYDSPWHFGHYSFVVPVGCRYGFLGTRYSGIRRPGAKLTWQDQGEGDGWFTNTEVADARAAGYLVTFLGRGWAWEKLSTDFAEWAIWMDKAKQFYRAQRSDQDTATLEEQWTKLATVAAIGRLGMDCYESVPMRPEDVGEQWAYSPFESQEHVPVMLVKKMVPNSRGDLLIHVAVQVHAYVRRQMAITHGRLVASGLTPGMCNIDAWYITNASRVPSGLVEFGANLGQWKQKQLTLTPECGTIKIEQAGWVIAGNLNKTPGVPK